MYLEGNYFVLVKGTYQNFIDVMFNVDLKKSVRMA